MRLSLLQPVIEPGKIEANVRAIQALVDSAEGDLLVLPEYALTGPPVTGMDAGEWAARGARAISLLRVPAGKSLLVNSLTRLDGAIYNCSELLHTGQQQCKLSPTSVEIDAGIAAGQAQHIFSFGRRRFKVILCADFDCAELTDTDGLHFVVWMSHFDSEDVDRTLADVQRLSNTRGLRTFVAGLVADEGVGMSAYVDGKMQLALPSKQDILEVIVP